MTDPATVSARIKEGLPLVGQVIGNLRIPPHADHAALRSAGMTGLQRAAELYDPKSGLRFKPFAFRAIRFRLRDEIRRQAPTSRRGMDLRKQLEKATNRLSAQLGRDPSDTELAGALGVTLRRLAKMRERAAGEHLTSLDAPVGIDGSSTLHEIIPELTNAFDAASAEEVRGHVRSAVEMMEPGRTRDVVESHFLHGELLAAIGERYGLTESRISQIAKHGVAILRVNFTKLLRADGQPDFHLPKYTPKPLPQTLDTMSRKARINWTDEEIAAIAKAFAELRLLSPFASTALLLKQAEARAIAIDRRRNITAIAFCSKLEEKIPEACAAYLKNASVSASVNAHSERTAEGKSLRDIVGAAGVGELVEAIAHRGDLSVTVPARLVA